jgi:phage-related protein
MASPFLTEGEKTLYWVGSSKEELKSFPAEVQDDIGFALGAAQLGGKADTAKPWKGAGGGVWEIVEDDGNAYRAVYTVRFEKALYVLHAFQKKSTRGIETSPRDIKAVKDALRAAEEHYEENYRRKS